MAMTEVTADNFAQEVLQEEKTVLVDFWAGWCGPCKMLAPIVEQIAEGHPDVKVCKVNIDEAPSLATDYKIMSIPTLLLFKNGQKVGMTVGVQSKEDIEAFLLHQ